MYFFMALLSTSTYFIGCQMEINLGNSDEPFAGAYGHLPLRSIFSRRVQQNISAQLQNICSAIL